MIESSLVYLFCFIVLIQGVQTDRLKLSQAITIFCFSALAFTFQPLPSDDLLREFSALDGIRENGWKYFSVNSSVVDGSMGTMTSSKFNGLFVSQLIYYLASKFPVYNLLPAIIAGVQFFLQFKIINKLRRKYNLDGIVLILIIISMICFREYRYMISGLRNQLAFTLALYILYVDLFEKKNFIKCIVGYILCGMIHQTVYAVLFLRLLLFIPSNYILAVVSVGLLFWSDFLSVIKTQLLHYIANPIINSIVWKLTAYTEGDTSNTVVNRFYMILILSNVALLLLSAVSAFYFVHLKEHSIRFYHDDSISHDVEARSERNAIWFMILALFLTIGSNMYYWMFLRFSIILQIWSIVVIAMMFNRIRGYSNSNNNYMLAIFMTVICKFSITVLLLHSSFNFSLFGVYPR